MNPRFAAIAAAVLSAWSAQAANDYVLGPDSQPQAGVPEGKVIHKTFAQSKVFPGTTRDYWIYVPAQYDASKPACLMVFQDGGGYQDRKGGWRVPVVFDNLIQKKEMPVTIGVFVNPGVVPAPSTNAQPRFNRSFEYDGMGDAYARFLLEELLPEVEKDYNLAKDGNSRAIGGASSGAIAAFTAAWERPKSFTRVFSTIGTYVGLRGGHNYPILIRKTEPKPLRVFLQDGSNDLNIYGGSWWVANQDMLSALEFAGYEVNHAWGDGGHDGKQGGSILPDALRWLWKDYPVAVKAGYNPKHPLNDILAEGEGWQLVGEGYKFTEGPTANEKGEVFFTDIPNNRIHKIGLDGKVTVFAENTGGANGLKFGPDGRLYACQNNKKRIVSYDMSGAEKVVAEGNGSNDIAINNKGEIYYTDPDAKKVWHVSSTGAQKLVDEGLGFANGVLFSTDQSLLFVADTKGQFVYSYQPQADGTLAYKQKYFDLHIPDGAADSGADGMTTDTAGRLYVTTRMGVQVCDQPGRVNGIISKPGPGWLSNATFGGAGLDELYVTCGEKIWKRKTKAKGVLSFQPPVKPPTPRL